MRSDIFIEWLKHLDHYFRTKDRKVLLLIDNAGSHFNPKVLDENSDPDEEVNEEIVAESSCTAQNRKKHRKSKQKKKKPDIKLIIGKRRHRDSRWHRNRRIPAQQPWFH